MLRQLLLLCLLLSAIQAQAEDFPGVQYVRAYDADTITVNLKDLPPVFGEELGIRVAGIDAPEIRGRCAQEEQLALQARDRVRELLEQAQQIDLVDVERDKYFRVVAKVNVDGRDLSQLLLEEGHAVIYDGGTKSKDWCVLGTEEPVLVSNPWLAWAAAQLFPILLSGRLLFNRQRKALSVSGRLRRVLLLFVIWNFYWFWAIWDTATGGNLETCETVMQERLQGMVVYPANRKVSGIFGQIPSLLN